MGVGRTKLITKGGVPVKFLDGYKTYIVAAGAILTAVGGYLTGAIDAVTAINSVLAALGLSTLRHGVSKVEKK
jgi:hypothetical protein